MVRAGYQPHVRVRRVDQDRVMVLECEQERDRLLALNVAVSPAAQLEYLPGIGGSGCLDLRVAQLWIQTALAADLKVIIYGCAARRGRHKDTHGRQSRDEAGNSQGLLQTQTRFS